MDRLFTLSIVFILGLFFGYHLRNGKNNSKEKEQTECVIKPTFFSQTPKEGLKEALNYYNIQHKDIVYAQAVLETGHFKSKGCVEDNNLFGLYNSRKGEYHKFNHWHESVKAYKEWIQSKYDGKKDYYDFLISICYAQDSNYVKVVKTICKQNK